MQKNILNHYVIELLKSIERNLSIYLKNMNPECLHHLRVDIKKIKATLSFAENVYEEAYNTTMLNPLFCKAGKIREIQLNSHLLELFAHPPKKLIEQLKIKENILTLKLIKRGSRYLKLIKKYCQTINLPEKLPNKTIINHYFKNQKNKANKQLKNKERLDLHQYRKKIKKIMYVYNALPKKIKKEIELNEVEIKIRQKKLGDWHDTYSAIKFISHKHFSMDTNESVLKLKEKEKIQFITLLKNLTNNHI